MWTADKRPLGCKLELGLDVQNPAKRCNFSDIQFSDVVRVPRPADPGHLAVLHFWWSPGLSQNLTNPVRNPKSGEKM